MKSTHFYSKTLNHSSFSYFHKFVALGFIISAFLLHNSLLLSQEAKYSVNLDKSKVSWKGSKVNGEHLGHVGISSGAFNKKGKGYSGNIVIDMNDITCTDIKSKGSNAKLVKHLKSEDFFEVKKFPDASIEISAIKVQAKGKAELQGKLTIKGVTKEVSIPVTFKEDKKSLILKGSFSIDRTDFNIKYKSKKYFPKLKDKFIYDEFEIGFYITVKS